MVTTFTVASVTDLTPELVSQIVGADVVGVVSTPLATGNMNASSRLHLTYAAGAAWSRTSAAIHDHDALALLP